MNCVGSLKPYLTRVVLRLVHRAACDGRERISLLDEPTDVYTYRSPDPPFAQVTPLGTILWNTTYMDRLSPSTQRVVLRHECSHRDRSRLFRIAFVGMMGLFGVGLAFVVRAVQLVGQHGAHAEGVSSALLGLGLVLAAVLTVRLEEGLADYHALREVGEAQFLGAYEEIRAASPGTTSHRLVCRVVYPHPRTVVRFHRRIQHASRGSHSLVGLLFSYLKGSRREVPQ